MYNLTIINLDTTRRTTLLNTSSKTTVIAKMQGYLTRLGLDDNSVIALVKDNTHVTLFYHPTIKAYCVIRLRKIIA